MLYFCPAREAIFPPSVYKFGEFELDGARFELRRSGRVQKLERIPLELLILLAEKNGEVASRQEIVERLWGRDVFVDTEHGINTAIRKIRTALRDEAEGSRFIQTVSGKGYRFIGEIKGEARAGALAAQPVAPVLPLRHGETAPTVRVKRLSWRPAAWVALTLILVAGVLFA